MMLRDYIRLPAHWRPSKLVNRFEPSHALSQWLTDPRSLTLKLRSLCPQLQVRILSERWEKPSTSEAIKLGLSGSQKAWIRTVTLNCGETPLVYARTVIPHCHPGNPWFVLKLLGDRPLGEILFQKHQVERSEFEISRQMLANWPYLTAILQEKTTQDISYARRCLFQEKGHPLLLTEAFLEDPVNALRID